MLKKLLKYLTVLSQRHFFFQIFNVSGRRANYNVVVIVNMLANLEMNTMYLFNQLSLHLIYSTGTTHGWIEHNLSLDHYFSPRVSSKKIIMWSRFERKHYCVCRRSSVTLREQNYKQNYNVPSLGRNRIFKARGG